MVTVASVCGSECLDVSRVWMQVVVWARRSDTWWMRGPAAVCSPSSLSSRWPLCSLPPSLSFFSLSTLLFRSLVNYFQTSTIHRGLCMCIHARQRRQIQSCTHTSLSLFNHWVCYRGYFPRQCLRRRRARQAEWERGDLSIPHHMEASALALPLTEMNEFNISPFWSADDLTIRLSVSLSQEEVFFSLFALPVKSGNAQEGIWRDFDRD